MNKPINVYWTPSIDNPDNVDWTLLYPKPESLFINQVKNQNKDTKNESFFACPAVANKFKKTLVFSNALNSSYVFEYENIKNISKNYIGAECIRQPSVDYGFMYRISLGYLLFADEPLNVYFTPPMFHRPGYTLNGTIIPGEFDIGQWFRPFNIEIQTWDKTGELHFKEDEPLFYAELKTNRPILLHRFNYTQKIDNYSRLCIGKNIFGSESLFSRYTRFNKVGLREKILTEIKKNIIDEEPLKL